MDDRLIWPLIEGGFITHVSDALTDAGQPDLCFADVVPGAQVALDYCGNGKCGGMLWVRAGMVFPSLDFPNAIDYGTTLPESQALHAFEIEVGVVRSAPPMSGRGEPPTAAQQRAAARTQMTDMSVIRKAVCAYLNAEDREFVVTQWTPVGPEGGCVGGGWLFTVRQGF